MSFVWINIAMDYILLENYILCVVIAMVCIHPEKQDTARSFAAIICHGLYLS